VYIKKMERGAAMLKKLRIVALLALVMIVFVALGTRTSAAEDPPKDRSPYSKVASGHPPSKDAAVRVYTNADLEKMFGIVAAEDREPGAVAADAADDVASTKPAQAKPTEDPLVWLKKRQEAAAARSVALAEAEKEVTDARARLAEIEKQKMAVRNPYAARPKLSEEEQQRRREAGETAGERFERTEALVRAAREEVRAAEAKLAQLRSKRP
jgi:hypothetical protein